jgi:hypothetical protein
MDAELPLGRKRATHQGHVINRAAKNIARPQQNLLSGWQQQVAFLRAMSLSRKSEIDRERVKRLRREIAASHLDFLQSRNRDVGAAGMHSLLRDLDRSYRFLLSELSALDGDLEH